MKFANISIIKGNIISYRKDDKSDRVINIGDYAQLFAIDNLYREMGIDEQDIVRIEYYDLLDYDGDYVILPINFIYFNPYYGERELVLSPKIIPVFLGIHCISSAFTQNEIAYLKSFAPIGCRDEHTLQILRDLNIPAYLQGCLTITFPKRQKEPNDGKVFFVDIPDSLVQFIPASIRDKAEMLSQQYYGEISDSVDGKIISDFARNQFEKYRDQAELVVTSRLHCASPCTAMGIPTIFAVDSFGPSFSWIEKINDVYTRDYFDKINWNPEKIEFEKEKSQIKELAKNRIMQAYNYYASMYEISEFYEKREKHDYEAAYLKNIRMHAEKYWDKKSTIKYAFWGITQVADVVQKFIKANYPNAELVTIFDDYRNISFGGVDSIKTNQLDASYEDCCIIATGNSSCIAAKELFLKKSRDEKFYCLCFSSKYDKI